MSKWPNMQPTKDMILGSAIHRLILDGEEPAAAVIKAKSVYDQFKRPGGLGYDYQAMEDAGFDIS